jgi:hypothetical protein
MQKARGYRGLLEPAVIGRDREQYPKRRPPVISVKMKEKVSLGREKNGCLVAEKNGS